MNRFLTSNDWRFRLLRTIVQGIIAFFVANIDTIINALEWSPTAKLIIAGLAMAILSPLMAELGKYTTIDEEEIEG